MNSRDLFGRYGTSCGSLIPRGNGLMIFIMTIALFVAPVVRPLVQPHEPGAYMGTVIANMYIVLFTAITAREMFSLPFAFFLPRHRELVRLHLLKFGLIFNGLFLLLSLMYPAQTIPEKISAIAAIFGLGMGTYLGYCATVIRMRDSTLISFLPWAFWLLLMARGYDFDTWMGLTVAQSPVLLLFGALLTFFLYWGSFTDRERFRNQVGTPYLSFTDGMSPSKARRYYEEISARKKAGRLRRAGMTGKEKETAGRLYGHAGMSCFEREMFLLWRAAWGKMASAYFWTAILINALFIVGVILMNAKAKAGEGEPMGLAFFLFIFAVMSVFFQNANERLSPFLPYSRNEKMLAFWGISLIRTSLLVLTAFIIREAFIAIFIWQDLYITGVYSIRAIFFSTLMAPVAYVIKLQLRTENSLAGVAFFGTAILFTIGYYFSVNAFGYEQASPLTIVFLHLPTWGFYWLVLRNHYHRRDLILNAQ